MLWLKSWVGGDASGRTWTNPQQKLLTRMICSRVDYLHVMAATGNGHIYTIAGTMLRGGEGCSGCPGAQGPRASVYWYTDSWHRGWEALVHSAAPSLRMKACIPHWRTGKGRHLQGGPEVMAPMSLPAVGKQRSYEAWRRRRWFCEALGIFGRCLK